MGGALANGLDSTLVERADAVKAAIDSGALEFTLDGVTYRRKSRRGRSFTRVG